MPQDSFQTIYISSDSWRRRARSFFTTRPAVAELEVIPQSTGQTWHMAAEGHREGKKNFDFLYDFRLK